MLTEPEEDEEITDPFYRQLGLVHPEQLIGLGRVVLIGTGGIGSWVGLALAKMGVVGLEAIDADTVEIHNQSNQLYGERDIGRSKVDALGRIVGDLAVTCEVTMIQKEVGKGLGIPEGRRVVISGVDSMKARADIWEAVKAAKPEWYMDGRMGAKVCQLYSVNMADPKAMEAYAKSLYSDEEATEDPCTARSIVYTPLWMAGIIADNVARIATGSDVPPPSETWDYVTRTHIL